MLKIARYIRGIILDIEYQIIPLFETYSFRIGKLSWSLKSFSAAITNICNAKCTFCAYPIVKLKRGIMNEELFKKGIIAWKSYGGFHIDLTPTVGDPLIDPGLFDKIKIARNAGLTTSLTTNAILLKDSAKNLLDTGLNELYISLPSFSQDLYKKIYQVDKVDLVKQGIYEFLSLNKNNGEPCKVRLRFRNSEKPSVIIKSKDFIEIIEPFLSKRVSVNFTSGFDNWGGLIKQEAMSGVMRLKKQRKSNRPCNGLFGFSMQYDGKLRACACRFISSDCDDLIVGHIDEGLEIASQRTKKIVKDFIKGNRPKTCENCTLYNPV